jgi:hypothetical protein
MSRQGNIKGIKQLRTLLLGGFVMLMVLVYLAGALQFNALHAALHAEAQEDIHSPEREQEACHKAIYHQAQEGSCQHKTHLVANDRCLLCHLIVSVADPITVYRPSEFHEHQSRVQSMLYSCVCQEFISLLPSRAPPVCQTSAF